MAKKTSYSEAIEELNTILSELENSEQFDMVVVTKKVNRAAELLALCKKELKSIDVELESLLEKLD